MFKNPFSFRGRIDKREYLFSLGFTMMVLGLIVMLCHNAVYSFLLVFFVLLSGIPLMWYILAQGGQKMPRLRKERLVSTYSVLFCLADFC